VQSLRDSAKELAAFDVAYYMVSLDTPEKNYEFAKSLDAEFPVISDVSGEAAKAYGVMKEGRPYPMRWTFYIDPDGIVRKVDREVNPDTAGADAVRTLQDLGFPRR